MSKRKKKALRGGQSKDLVVSVRVSATTAADLDRYVNELRSAEPGASWTRSSAALNLIAKALLRWQAGQDEIAASRGDSK